MSILQTSETRNYYDSTCSHYKTIWFIPQTWDWSEKDTAPDPKLTQITEYQALVLRLGKKALIKFNQIKTTHRALNQTVSFWDKPEKRNLKILDGRVDWLKGLMRISAQLVSLSSHQWRKEFLFSIGKHLSLNYQLWKWNCNGKCVVR